MAQAGRGGGPWPIWLFLTIPFNGPVARDVIEVSGAADDNARFLGVSAPSTRAERFTRNADLAHFTFR
jgi:hypothetical protein